VLSGAMYRQMETSAALVRTSHTLQKSFREPLGHTRLVLLQHVGAMVGSTMEDPTMEGTTMEGTTMVDIIMVDPNSTMVDLDSTMEDITMEDTIMEDPSMVDITMVDLQLGDP